jgi:hypothetical protein
MPPKKAHRNCPSYGICVDLRKLLKKTGGQASVEKLCEAEDEWPCRFLLKNVQTLYGAVSPENAGDVLEFVSELFARPEQMVSTQFQRNAQRSPFHCPELDIDMYQPCAVSSCTFYTDNAWTMNCILFYRLHQGKEVLSLNELSFLLGKDVGGLRASLNKAFRSLGEAALKETISRDHTNELMDRVYPENVCAVCETRMDSARAMVTRAQFHYCSDACADEKPPQILRLEQNFLLPIERIIELCVVRFSTVKHMCSALGASATTFIEWCGKYDVDLPPAKLGK